MKRSEMIEAIRVGMTNGMTSPEEVLLVIEENDMSPPPTTSMSKMLVKDLKGFKWEDEDAV